MAYKIIDLKRSTYYGIGVCLARIAKAVLNNEKTTLMVGAKLNGEYKQKQIYAGVPAIIDAFVSHGKEVTLVDFANRIMPVYYDKNFTDLMEQRMTKAGVKLVLGQGVKEFKGKDGKVNQVVTDKMTIDTDYVVFSVGVKPQTELLKGVVDLSDRGAIKTNEFAQTSNKDIYAIGDCSEVFNASTHQNGPVQLATTAVRTAIVAAVNVITNNTLPSPGFAGANGIEVFGFKMASVGISKEAADRMDLM
ncbi:hypothetical protein FQA39_LY12802 [Lamprigera yunnana]|nr:hypothetical protein FQA39_LY12802 [Lamprigera yunnana]